jgi:hypothetical protein
VGEKQMSAENFQIILEQIPFVHRLLTGPRTKERPHKTQAILCMSIALRQCRGD